MRTADSVREGEVMVFCFREAELNWRQELTYQISHYVGEHFREPLTLGTLAQELGLSLWDVQFVKEGADWFLRIFIDKEGGVSIDDCVDMTHAIDPVLDREDPIPQEYLLEVSSPGLERKLTRPQHFAAYVGKPVRARLIRPLETGERELCGVLLSAEEDGSRFELQLDEETSVTLEKKECSAVTAADDGFDG